MEMGVRRAEAAGGLGTRSGDRAHQHPAPLTPDEKMQWLDLPPHPTSGTGTTRAAGTPVLTWIRSPINPTPPHKAAVPPVEGTD